MRPDTTNLNYISETPHKDTYEACVDITNLNDISETPHKDTYEAWYCKSRNIPSLLSCNALVFCHFA